MENEKDMVIFSQYLAGKLMMEGCRLKKIKPDRNEPTKFVYFFENSELVKNHVCRYKLNKQNNRKDEDDE
jgi:hypothetical protein